MNVTQHNSRRRRNRHCNPAVILMSAVQEAGEKLFVAEFFNQQLIKSVGQANPVAALLLTEQRESIRSAGARLAHLDASLRGFLDALQRTAKSVRNYIG